ncbi:hypothetical protein A1O3_04442 [Capronia epimyces CBS 606.96]|uniref:Alpha/beta hydrolase fold-3 domain-containing protein n=1 Tax=Capronia epimyces CBS 606.96 TaxID=1182542 RepID=W9Y3V0_9EURO|nr:uncharacterized protein A1O3_04442 [Capronia epimyces CBS 606.96]EXJ87482.1 hypothetical protein A1O3_04442 [Capronia epimyces CBS 606.96]
MPLELAEEWQAFEAMLGTRPKIAGKDIPDIRANIEKTRAGVPPPGPSENDEQLEQFPVRIYTPKEAGKVTHLAVFFLSVLPLIDDQGLPFCADGGGFCVGDLDGEDAFVRFIADQASLTVVSVGYRLAPEYPWPASRDDCIAATRWALDKFATSESIDTSKFVLCGTSAGGQLALSTAAALIQSGLRPHGIVALAPLTVGESAVPPELKPRYQSMTENADGPVVDKTLIDQFMRANGHDDADPSFSVLLSPVLSEFPKTYIVTCGADTLRDDGRLLQSELAKHGVPVQHDDYPGYPHVFWAMPGLKETAKFQANLVTGFKFVLS